MSFSLSALGLAVLVWGGMTVAKKIGDRQPRPDTPYDQLPDTTSSPTPIINRSIDPPTAMPGSARTSVRDLGREHGGNAAPFGSQASPSGARL